MHERLHVYVWMCELFVCVECTHACVTLLSNPGNLHRLRHAVLMFSSESLALVVFGRVMSAAQGGAHGGLCRGVFAVLVRRAVSCSNEYVPMEC